MEGFIRNHAPVVTGVLYGFDRMRFRGTLRSISYAQGLDRFLGAAGVRYADFGRFAESLSHRIKQHAEAMTRKMGRPFLYLASGGQSKESLARSIAEHDGIQEGLICVLRAVEPCMSFAIRRNSHGQFGFVGQERKCLHLYFYYMDREFGLMHVRLATWLPFTIQICVNGREYLARRMRLEGIGFEQRENCFTRIDHLARAQAMMDDLVNRKWERFLQTLARRVNPLPARLNLFAYYWSLKESEYATDVMFQDSAALDRLYPALVDHAIRHFSSRDVLRFMGRRICPSRFGGDVTSSRLERREGVRVKHWVEENSIKIYNKQGSVLRVETTINNVRRFKVRRRVVRDGVCSMRWVPMRFGLADLARRVEVSRAANARYLEALAVVHMPAPVSVLLDAVDRRVIREHRPYRALHPVSQQDAQVFRCVLAGEFLLRGFSNRDLRQRLGCRGSRDPDQQRRESGRITRLLRLLRAHRLIRKVSSTRYYRVTLRGRQIMTAALSLRQADATALAA